MMGTREFILEFSKEGRAWCELVLPYLVPVVTAFLAGVHLPQPKYMTRTPPETPK